MSTVFLCKTVMKKSQLKLFTQKLIISSLIAIFWLNPVLAQQDSINRVEIYKILNDVQLLRPHQPPRPLKKGDVLVPGDVIRTGAKSRVELLFNDGSLARIGAKSTFRLTPGLRRFQLPSNSSQFIVERGNVLITTPNGDIITPNGFLGEIITLNNGIAQPTDDAKDYYRAIEKEPNNAVPYVGLGWLLRKQKKLYEAIAAFQKAIQLNPKYTVAYVGLGSTLANQNKLDAAIAAFQKAIQIDPQYTIAHLSLGNALHRQRKLDAAIASFRQALKLPEDKNIQPTSAHTLAHNNLGYALQQQGKLTEAIVEFQLALKLDSEYATAQNNLKEAQRLLALKQNPQPSIIDDRQWVPSPQEEPLVGVLRSVVRIIATNSSPSTNYGAGWVIKRQGNKAWIVTNRHVVTDPEVTNRPSNKIELEFYSEPPPNKYIPRYTAKINKITDAQDSLDLAVLEVTNIPEDIKPLPTYTGRVSRTTPVRVIGHPSNGGLWTAVTGEVSNFLHQPRQIQINATLAEGNSGGPVIDQEKRVVGLMVQISNPGQTLQNATDTDQQALPPATGGFGFAYSMDVVLEKMRNWGIL